MWINFKLHFLYFLTITTIATISSCYQNNDTPLGHFCKTFKKKIDSDTLFVFKNINEDSLEEMYYLLKDRAIEVLQENIELNNQLDSFGISSNEAKAYILIVSFHRILNNKEINFAKQIEKLKKIIKDSEEFIEKQKKCEQERMNIAKINLNNCTIGDTLNLKFPVSFNYNVKSVFYYDCPSAYASYNTDYLYLKGVLEGVDTINYYNATKGWNFILKVVEVSDTTTFLSFDKIKKNDTIIVNMESYGRIIK